MEGFPKKETIFVFPDVEKECGEIERVAQKYDPQDRNNTDWFDIPYNGWEQVAEHIDHTNRETGATRSWEALKQKMERGQELDAPIVLKYQDELHLVSGNTRLMVARASGKTSKVLLVKM